MAETPDELEEMNKVRNQADAVRIVANSTTKTLERILEQIDPIVKKGYPFAQVDIHTKVTEDEMSRTLTILRIRGFKVSDSFHSTPEGPLRRLKIEWILDQK